MKKLIVLYFIIISCSQVADAQFNYQAANATVYQGVYTKLGNLGTAITTNFAGFPISYDDTVSSAQNIGFNFIFNGTTFTKFILSTNGFIRLGTTPPSDVTYDFLSTTETNIISPFNLDIEGTDSAGYRVYTSGTIGFRICTIEYNNVRDLSFTTGQYSNICFQIKLFEGTNNIEFVYGTFTPTLNPSALVTAKTGIKGSNVNYSVNAVKSSIVSWSNTSFIDGPYITNSFNNRNNILPSPGFTLRFTAAPIPAIDGKVNFVYSMGEVPLPYGFPHTVRAQIKNVGAQKLRNLPVTLTVTGASTFTSIKTIDSIAVGATGDVTFDSYNYNDTGVNNVVVSIPADSNNANNSQTYDQHVNANLFSYANSSPVAGYAGFGTGSGVLLARYYMNGTGIVASVRVHISNDANNVGRTVYAEVTNSVGLIIGRSDDVVIATSDLNNYKEFILRSPANVSNNSFYVGLAQNASIYSHYPVSYQSEGNPTRTGAYYNASVGGSAPTEVTANSGRYMIQARVNDGLAPVIIQQPLAITKCEGAKDSISVITTGLSVRYKWYRNGVAIPNYTLAKIIFNAISVSDSGDYFVQVYNNIDTVYSNIIRVSVIPLARITNNDSTSLCSGRALGLTITSSVVATYVWSASDNINISGESLVIKNSVIINDTLVNNTFNPQYVRYSIVPSSRGCVGNTKLLIIKVNPIPVMNSAGSTIICSGTSAGINLTSTVSGASFSWIATNNANTIGESLTAKGTSIITDTIINNTNVNQIVNYSVVPTFSGCAGSSQAIQVTVKPKPKITGFSQVNPTACNSVTGKITLSGLVSGTTYAVSYSKNSGLPVTINLQASLGLITITGLTAGVYSNIQVVLNGCTSNIVGPVTITDPLNPSTPVVSNNGPLCSGAVLNLTASTSSTGVASYSWTGPNSFVSQNQNPVISNTTTLVSGIYNVTATINGCVSAPGSTSVIVDSTPIKPIVSATNPSCDNTSLEFFASISTNQSVNWLWTGPNSYTSTLQYPSILNPTSANNGTYTAIAFSSSQGCISLSSSVTVTVNTAPHIDSSISFDPISCGSSSGSISLFGLLPDTSYIVIFKKNNVLQTDTIISSLLGEVFIGDLVASSYSDIKVILNGCISNAVGPYYLSDPNAPNPSIVSGSSPVCLGDSIYFSIVLTSPGIADFSWSGPNGFSSTLANPIIDNASASASGIYNVITTISGCSSASGVVNILVNVLPSDLFTGDTIKACGISLILSTPGGYDSYLWNTGDQIQNITVDSTGLYKCTVSLYGCRAADSIYVSLLDGSILNNDTAVCRDQSVLLKASATPSIAGLSNAIIYRWSVDSISSTVLVRPLTTTQYYCSISNGITVCRDSTLVTVKQPSLITVTDTACVSYLWNNRTYTQSGTYSFTTLNYQGCDSVVYLQLTINQPTSSLTIQVSCVNYTWNGITYTQSGTYTYRTLNSKGCDSLASIQLTINQPTSSLSTQVSCVNYIWNGIAYTQSGSYTYRTINSKGCDSVATLQLTINQPSSSLTTIVACVNYMWNGVTYTQTGNYLYSTLNVKGCDSLATLQLTINQTSSSLTSRVSCVNYLWNGTTYTQSGTYSYISQNSKGCDSVATLQLTINQSTSSLSTQVSCVNYLWNGIAYTQSGSYTYQTINSKGCDSVASLQLTINQPTSSLFTQVSCVNYIWNGFAYTQSGTYTYQTTNSKGCDSVASLQLTINQTTSSLTNQVSCVNYTWNGITYTQSGIYTYLTLNSKGCDSVATLLLTINQPTSSLTRTSACINYYWNGTIYTQSGTYSFSTQNSKGCDSIATLQLSINLPSSSITTKVSCVNFYWNGITYTQSGAYLYNTLNSKGCDSVATLQLTINQPSSSFNPIVACVNYTWNGITYTQSGTYTYRTLNLKGCDSLATLQLTINQTSSSLTIIVACASYYWNGTTYTQSGTYSYTSQNLKGCDSLAILQLTINPTTSSTAIRSSCINYTWNGNTYTQSGTYSFTTLNSKGCDSIAILNLVIHRPSSSFNTLYACIRYSWNGNVYTQSGNYTYNTQDVYGCDSTAVLNLVIGDRSYSFSNISACINYAWNNNIYTQSGTYTDTSIGSAGCDSVAVLNLTINQPSSSISNISACSNYFWNGVTYTQSGVYTFSTLNAGGCDSLATLNLVIKQPSVSSSIKVVCESYLWNSLIYTQSGTYTYITTNSVGCDSVATLRLTINPATSSIFTKVACINFTWNGTTYSQSGIYTYHTTNASGCDSVATLLLTINQPTSSITLKSACSYFIWNGTTYTQSGIYTYNTLNASGCDSLATLRLTINQPSSSLILINACDNYTWNGTTYTQSGTYIFNTTNASGCDSIATLFLTIKKSTASNTTINSCINYLWNGVTYTQSGIYTFSTLNSVRCDSIASLNLTIYFPYYSDTTVIACDQYSWNGTTYTQSGIYAHSLSSTYICDSIATLHLSIYPHPIISVFALPIKCFRGFSDVQVSATSGTLPYLGTGTFSQYAGATTYVVTDSVGCQSSYLLNLSQPTQLIDTIIATASVEGHSNGTAIIIASGGQPPYSYLWSNGAVTDAIVGLAPGSYFISLTDSSGCVKNDTVIISLAESNCKGFVTYSQLSWGTPTMGMYIRNNFNKYFVYPRFLTIGCDAGNTLRLNNYNAIDDFLPSEGPSGVLPQGIMVDPGSTYKNLLAGELVALSLNVICDSSDPLFSPAYSHLQGLVVAYGPFANLTVRQVLDEANRYLGGCSSVYNEVQLYSALRSININFEDGLVDRGYLVCDPSSSSTDSLKGPRFFDNTSVSIYPNPSYGPFVVRIKLDAPSEIGLSLFDSKGALVYNREMGTQQTGIVNVFVGYERQFPVGIYFLRVVQGDKISYHRVMFGTTK